MNDLKPKLKKSKIVKKEKKNIKQSPLDLKKKKSKRKLEATFSEKNELC